MRSAEVMSHKESEHFVASTFSGLCRPRHFMEVPHVLPRLHPRTESSHYGGNCNNGWRLIAATCAEF